MYQAAVLTLSDKGSRGAREDLSGKKICDVLLEKGYNVVEYTVIPDEFELIKEKLIEFSDKNINLIITTGGTGFSKREREPDFSGLCWDR